MVGLVVSRVVAIPVTQGCGDLAWLGSLLKCFNIEAEPILQQTMERSILYIKMPTLLADSNQTILIADDEPSISKILSTRLSLKGYTVLTAADGQEALEVLELLPYKIKKP